MRRWGPLVAIALIAIVVGVILLTTTGKGSRTVSGPTPSTTLAGTGAISFSQAKKLGRKDVTFQKGCDLIRGRAALPFFFAPECYANTADNGGATSKGVAADTVTVVVYLAPATDPILDFITAAIKTHDTPQQIADTYQGYTDMFNALYQTYGRKVVLKFLNGSGTSVDEVAARADAVKAADQLGAFAVWGGPALTNAFADELAARKVICIGCFGGSPGWTLQRAPYVIGVVANQEQVLRQVSEYVAKKLAGRPAVHAGAPALQTLTRKFGHVWIDSGPDSKTNTDTFVTELQKQGVSLAQNVAYTLDPARLQEQATSVIAKLKDAGVTTLIFSGDPVAPGTFTKEATAQGYFPEWVLGGQLLADTNAFSRTYDRRQWAHAFGPSDLSVRLVPTAPGSSYTLYQWFKGTPPPAVDTSGVRFPNPSVFFAGLQAAGPKLTPETFRDGLFAPDPSPNALTQPSISFGNHGLWPYTDYNGVDDFAEVWWNPDVIGADELRRSAAGMWEFVDGGKRYLPGTVTNDASKVFDPAGAVTILSTPPAAETPPSYPSPAGG